MRILKKLIKEEKSSVFCIKLALLALVIRLCLGAAYYNYFVLHLKTPLYAFDGEVYSIIGWYIALVLKGVNLFSLPGFLVPNDFAVVGGFFGTIVNFDGRLPTIYQYGVGIYSYIVAIFYYIFGYAPVLLRFVNAALSVMSAFLAYDIAKRVFNENVGRISFVIMLFNPSFILYSISLQRDTFVNFLILLIISELLKINKSNSAGRRTLSIIISLSALALLYSVRVNSMAVLSLFIIILLYIGFARAFKRLALYLTIGIFLIPPLYNKIFSVLYSKWVLMLKYHWGLTFLGGYTFKFLPDRYYASGDSGEGWFSQGVGVVDLVMATIKGLKTFFLEPSIFSMNKIQHLMALPQMLIWYFIVTLACAGIYSSIKSPSFSKIALIVVTCLFTLSIGLSEANAETLIRHRDMIVSIYIIFAAYGMSRIGRLNDKVVNR